MAAEASFLLMANNRVAVISGGESGIFINGKKVAIGQIQVLAQNDEIMIPRVTDRVIRFVYSKECVARQEKAAAQTPVMDVSRLEAIARKIIGMLTFLAYI
jgi:hypothetical protein